MKHIKNDSANAGKYLMLMEKATLELDDNIYKIVAQTKTNVIE